MKIVMVAETEECGASEHCQPAECSSFYGLFFPFVSLLSRSSLEKARALRQKGPALGQWGQHKIGQASRWLHNGGLH